MNIYIIIVIILILLAISDLIVGVSNDAVNFLNSAVGSRVAPRHIILIVAALGILAGTLFSSGMMEVARKGIFNPQYFYFSEIMTIFLAVMLTDVILLDLYNTFALPTSTTVSIVFELLGSAVAVALIKIGQKSESIEKLIQYINTAKAITIISGILLSVVVAFTVGAIVQFLVRFVFTFDYKKRIPRYGALWGGVSLAAITFFILIKGVGGATFMSASTKEWILTHAKEIILYSFVAWTIFFQILMFFKINIMKPIVLIGTFSLALAFAANDLVNFIGVPLAGLNAYQLTSNVGDPSNVLMKALSGKIHSNPWLLVIAGLIMIATLVVNRKARSVIKTSVDLSRQEEGYERFESSLISRIIVRKSIEFFSFVRKIMPGFLVTYVNNRFSNAEKTPVDDEGNPISFDLLRASVNLMVASVLISIATSWKLPLSTTYVTFMVAMGTSFSDRAWGRDSAVYRVNGVFTVIAGWFVTALMAFTVSAVFAVFIYYASYWAVAILISLAIYSVVRTHFYFKKEKEEEEEEQIQLGASGYEALLECMLQTKKFLLYVSKNLNATFDAFVNNNREQLHERKKKSKKIKKRANVIAGSIVEALRIIPETDVKKGKRFGKIMAAVQEVSSNSRALIEKIYSHIENNHTPPNKEQSDELLKLTTTLGEMILEAGLFLETRETLTQFKVKLEELNLLIQKFEENQMNRLRMKGENFSARNSFLFLEILTHLENIAENIRHLISLCNKNYLSYQQPKSDPEVENKTQPSE